jgi:urease accessory protein
MSALLGGLLHPLLVPTHVITLVGLGLLACQQAARVRGAMVVTFAAGLLAGLVAVVMAFAVEDADVVALLCGAAAGLLTAFAQPAPLLLATPLAAVAGVAIELDSVPEEISMRATVLALAGTMITATVTLILVAAITADRTRDWQRIGIRILGSWIAASAILVLALRLTQ